MKDKRKKPEEEKMRRTEGQKGRRGVGTNVYFSPLDPHSEKKCLKIISFYSFLTTGLIITNYEYQIKFLVN